MYLLMLGCLVFGWLCDLLFYGKSMGISYPVAVLAFYLLFLLYYRKGIKKGAWFAWFLSVPILLLSATYFFHTNTLFLVLNFIAVPILISAQTILLAGTNLYPWNNLMFVSDILYTCIVKVLTNVAKPFTATAAALKKHRREKTRLAGMILLGILISLPLVLMITGLLASSDMIFDYHFRQLQLAFKNINIAEIILRFIIAFILAIISFSYIYSIKIKPSIDLSGLQKEFETKILNPVTALTVLTIINIVYLFFTIIQFSYLFTGSKGLLPAGLTYSEYARKGFFELVAVTLLNFGIFLIVINVSKPSGRAVTVAVKIMCTLLMLFTAVILVSAHIRMSLYEQAFGYTYLRVLTHLFMGFLMLLIAVTLCKVWYTRMNLLAFYIVIGLLSYTLLNYLNIDAIIAKNNIERYRETGKIDVYYLTGLSYEAIPHVIDILDDLPQDERDVLDRWLESKLHHLGKAHSWQSYNLSRAKAEKAIRGVLMHK